MIGPDEKLHPDEVLIIVQWSIAALNLPPGLGSWTRTWEIVDPPSDAFLELHRTCRRDDELGCKRLRDAGRRVVLAWKQAAKEFRERKAS